MASKKTSKRTQVSFKDIQIAYLLDGVRAVEKLVAGRKTASVGLRRALRELKEQGRNTDALESYISERYGSGGRGRSLPTVGDERRYKAQQIKTGGAFLRLPLAPLGVRKGGSVRVRFESGKIVISRS